MDSSLPAALVSNFTTYGGRKFPMLTPPIRKVLSLRRPWPVPNRTIPPVTVPCTSRPSLSSRSVCPHAKQTSPASCGGWPTSGCAGRPASSTPARTVLFLLTREGVSARHCPVDPNIVADSSIVPGRSSRLLSPGIRRRLHEALPAGLAVGYNGARLRHAEAEAAMVSRSWSRSAQSTRCSSNWSERPRTKRRTTLIQFQLGYDWGTAGARPSSPFALDHDLRSICRGKIYSEDAWESNPPAPAPAAAHRF